MPHPGADGAHITVQPRTVSTMNGKRTRRRAPTTACGPLRVRSAPCRQHPGRRRLSHKGSFHSVMAEMRIPQPAHGSALRRASLYRSGAVIRILVLALTRPCRPVRSAAARAPCAACAAACRVCARKLAAYSEKRQRSLRMQVAFLESVLGSPADRTLVRGCGIRRYPTHVASASVPWYASFGGPTPLGIGFTQRSDSGWSGRDVHAGHHRRVVPAYFTT